MRSRIHKLLILAFLSSLFFAAPLNAADQISGDCTNPSPSAYNDLTIDLSNYSLPFTATFSNCYFFYLYDESNNQLTASEGNITTTPNSYNPATPSPGQAYTADPTQTFTINGPGRLFIYLPWYGTNGSGFNILFTYPTPVISSFSPWYSNVAGGTDVTISGSNFAPGATVQFGSVAATDVTVIDANTISAKTSPNVPAGNNYVNVTVTNPSGKSSVAGGFFYSNSPSISTITINSGPTSGGTEVQVYGSSLYLVDPLTSVTLDGVPIAVNSYSSTFFSITTPAHAPGSVDLSISTLGGNVTVANAFTFADQPTVTSLSPTSGTTAGGTTVTINGSNLANPTSVTFGGTSATIISSSSSQIVVTTPAKSAGTVSVAVTTAGGTVTSGTSYTYVSPTTKTSNRQSTNGSCTSASTNSTNKSNGKGSSQNANAFCTSTSGPSK